MVVVKKETLQAMLCVAPKKDIRAYLVGVHVTNDFIEATDGHTLCRVKPEFKGADYPYVEGDEFEVSDVNVIIPLETVKNAIKLCKKHVLPILNNTVAISQDTIRITDLERGTTTKIQFESIGENFPNTDLAIENAKSMDKVMKTIDTKILLTATKALSYITDFVNKPVSYGMATMFSYKNILCVVMHGKPGTKN